MTGNDTPRIHDASSEGSPLPKDATLRDYFAASALQGLATRRPAGVPTTAGELARFAFEIADAMLAARGK